ncbi:DUF421 domain-containing protein [Planococcus shixiaomingii]|uniref:DUF421 domain-containing protein n=1 Tax=Planococcus shixiaomingii TaxID=3058393 RepID=UPI002606D087|nr:DUF421 domain-containing protein [Planococcus sp. N022]WKA54295.1 DUF421 domain-containing protein [Planococcus sp. N022]
MTYFNIGAKLFFGLIALLIVTRLLGKKEISQLTPFDFIYSIVLGGLLEESIYEDKVTVFQLWFGIGLWGLLLFIIEKLSRKYDKIRVLLKGDSSILIHNGKLNLSEMKKNHLEMEQLRTMLRQQGVFSLREVKDLYLEPSGAISLKKFPEHSEVTPKMLNIQPKDEGLNFMFIDEGEVNEITLNYCGKNMAWLYEELGRKGYTKLKDILYAEWTENEGFYIKTYRENEHKETTTKGN